MEICGAKNRQGTPCQHPAGWGTPHKGTGRCKLHGGLSPGAPKGNRNAEKTGEYSQGFLERAPERFRKVYEEAPVESTVMLQDQARRTLARLEYMYGKLWQIEKSLQELAEAGDEDAEKALVMIKAKHKKGLDQIGDMTDWTQTEAKSLYDRWLDQQDAITRVERLYSRIAEQLKPKDGQGAGGIGTIIINNRMPGVDDDDAEE